jgi:hypothetical protein
MHRVVEARFRELVADPRSPAREVKVLTESSDLEMWRSGDCLHMRVPGYDETTWSVHLSNVKCYRIHQTECPLPASIKGVEMSPDTKPSSPRMPVAKKARGKREAA